MPTKSSNFELTILFISLNEFYVNFTPMYLLLSACIPVLNWLEGMELRHFEVDINTEVDNLYVVSKNEMILNKILDDLAQFLIQTITMTANLK